MNTPCPVYCPNLIPGIDQEDWTNANANSVTIEAALQEKYGVLLLPSGPIHFERPIIIKRPVILRGSGECLRDETAIGTTKLIFPSVSINDPVREGHGIMIYGPLRDANQTLLWPGAGHTCIEDLTVYCANVPQSEGNKGCGIVVKASFVNLARVSVERFGEHGITFISDDSYNCNECSLSFVTSAYNGNTGYYVTHTSSGSNSNQISFLACRAFANRNYGFYDAAASNLYLHCSARHNTGPGYRFMKQGGAVILPYSEGTHEGMKMIFGPDSTGWSVILGPRGPIHMVNENDAVRPVVIAGPEVVAGTPEEPRLWTGNFSFQPPLD